MTMNNFLVYLPLIEEEAAKGIETIRKLRGGNTLPSIKRKPWPKTHSILGKGGASIVYSSTSREIEETFAARVVNAESHNRRTNESQCILARPIWMSSDPLLANINMNMPFAYSGDIAKGTEHFSTWSRHHRDGTLADLFHKIAYDQEAHQKAIHWFFPRVIGEYAKVHDAGYVICDIKPENILVDNAVPILADLDSFRLDLYNGKTTSTSQFAQNDQYTPKYISRRQLSEENPDPMGKQDDVEATSTMLAYIAFHLKDALPIQSFDPDEILQVREDFFKDPFFQKKSAELCMPDLYGVLRDGMQGNIESMHELYRRVEQATRTNY